MVIANSGSFTVAVTCPYEACEQSESSTLTLTNTTASVAASSTNSYVMSATGLSGTETCSDCGGNFTVSVSLGVTVAAPTP